MPSRAYTSFLLTGDSWRVLTVDMVSMPSRASTSLLQISRDSIVFTKKTVSMPSRASTSLLRGLQPHQLFLKTMIVSMPSRASTSLLPEVMLPQHHDQYRVNALTG